MPTKTINVAPEVFLDYSGVTVYHVYEQDDVDMGRLHGCFSVRTNDDHDEFDIRDFERMPSYVTLQMLMTTQRRFMKPGKKKQWLQHLKHAQAAVLKEAIDCGLIKSSPRTTEIEPMEASAAVTLCQRITALNGEGHSPLGERMLNEMAELVVHLPAITALAAAVRKLESLGTLSMCSDATPEDQAKQVARKAVADLKGIA